jgi:aminodeoxyfutalosine deaminase
VITDDDRRWIRTVPKIELHVHLEGSMSVPTVQALIERHGADSTPIWPEGLPESFSFDGFPDFSRQFLFGLDLLRSGDDLAAITDDLAATLAAQNVRYAEVTTTAFTHFHPLDGRAGMTPVEYGEGLNEGRRRAAARGVSIGWVVDIPRDLERPDETVTIDYLDSGAAPDGLVAIGLGGNEVENPAAPYAAHFERAAAIGLPAVPHAGETEGAHSVRSAVEDLGAVRVGHGVRCLEDPELVDVLVARGVLLEVCPTSNDLLQVVESIDAHPLPRLLDAGLRVCLNTDDPGWFANDLTGELIQASNCLGIDRERHRAMLLDAVDASFMTPSDKDDLGAAIAAH